MKQNHSSMELREVVLLGIPFHDVTMGETLLHIDRMVAARRPGYLATANLDFAAQAGSDVELQRILYEADLVLCDGTPLIWASHWLGAALRERVAGSDLLPELFAHASEKGHRIFFLGSSEEVLREATARCRQSWPGLNICGSYSPPYAGLLELDEDEITRRVGKAMPDIMLVAMGCPKQEKWIYKNCQRLGVPVSIGIGASLDFIAGKFKRAPVWMRVCGLEWVFRLSQEPTRLFSRYWKDLLFFVHSCYLQKKILQDDRSNPKTPFKSGVHLSRHRIEHHWIGRVDAKTIAVEKLCAIKPDLAHPNIILDCSKITFMDSTGLALLIKSYRNCKKSGGTLILRSPGNQVRSLLKAMKLDRLIPIADTEEAVVDCLYKGGLVGVDRVAYDPDSQTLTLLFTGDITANSVMDCQALLDSAWNQSKDVKRLRLDLAEVSFIDSSGLGFLIKSYKRVHARTDGGFTLLNVTPNVRNVIQLARLEALLGLAGS